MWISRKSVDPWLLNTVSRFALTADGDPPPVDDGGGGDPPPADGGGAATGPNWEGFTSSLESLNANLGGGLNTLIEEVRGMKPAPVEPPPPNFDEMTQGDLAAHIIARVTKAVEDTMTARLTPVVDAVNGIQRSASEREINEQVRQLQSNKDFNDWKPVMLELAKQPKYQTLDVVDLYALARAKNPAKAAEIDKKYAAPPEPPKPRWGGLTSGTVSIPTNGGTPPPMSGRAASEEAYREVAARHANVLRALEN